MEKVRKVVKKYYLRQIITYWLVCWMLLGLPAQVAMAVPSGGVVSPLAGGADITYGTTTQIDVFTGQTIIDWTGFDTSSSEFVNFLQAQGLSNSAVLNRISGGTTNFNGTLNGSEMRIFLVNPAGIVFGATSSVNVAQLVASALNMDPDDFLADTMTFQGGDGVVINRGTITATDSAYLIGGDVINEGTISAIGGDVVLVATMNDKVVITYPDSDVLVELAPPDVGLGISLLNGHELGSGDIWAQAMSSVTSGDITAVAENNISIIEGSEMVATAIAASDAVAEIDILAGGNVTIDSDTLVSAEATGNGIDNAIATVNVEAGGNAEVISFNGGVTTVEAIADDGVNNTATVSITADGDVSILGPDKVEVYAEAGVENVLDATLNEATIDIQGENVTVIADDTGFTNQPFVLMADAQNGDENIANISLTANGDEGGDVMITGTDMLAVENLMKANAQWGLENDADIMISATGDVSILAEDNDVRIEAHAHDGLESPATLNEANVEITGRNVSITAQNGFDTRVIATADNGVDNTAAVDVTANDGNINMTASNSSYLNVKAEAFDGENNNATVNMTATNQLSLYAYDNGGAFINAYAHDNVTSNTAAVTVVADDVLIEADNGSAADIWVEAYDGTDNTATVNVTANDGNVDVDAWNDSSAFIEADAYNAENSNEATVNVTALRAEDGEGDGDVIVDADNNSNAWIKAYASDDDESDTSTVNINADGVVDVTADDSSNASIEAYAEYGVTNTANVNVTADDVLVEADDNSEAEILAKASYGLDNTATTNVTANDGSVDVDAWNNGDASIEAEAYNAENSNSATVNVTARRPEESEEDSNVYVDADNSSYAAIEAYAGEDDESNTATVNVNSFGSVLVTAKDSSEAAIYAEAWDGLDNTSTVNVTANDGDVDVYAKDDSEAYIGAEAYNATNNNTATTNVTAEKAEVIDLSGDGDGDGDGDGSVYVTAKKDSGAFIYSETAYAGMNNSSTTNVNADGNVELFAKNNSGGEGWLDAAIGAWAGYDDESNTATVNVTAGGNVIVENDWDAEAYILASAEYGVTNQATVNVTAEDGYVEVYSDEGEAYIEAYARDGTDNTATVNVTAQDTEVDVALAGDGDYDDGDVVVYSNDEESEASIGAFAIGASNNNSATTNVNADKNILVEADNEGDSSIYAEAGFGYNNTATVNATANDGDVKVDAWDDSDASIEAAASLADNSNTATVNVTAKKAEDVEPAGDGDGDGSVYVDADNDSDAWIGAFSNTDDETNTTTVNINADGNVEVTADNHSYAEILSKTDEGGVNTSAITINAKGNVLVEAGDFSEAVVKASADDATVSNSATVAINATGENGDGDVEVKTLGDNNVGSHAKVIAEATDSPDNTAGITVNAVGDVDLEAVDGDVTVKAIADSGELDGVINDADIQITGANIEVTSEISDEWIDILPDDAIVFAYAAEGATNTANVSLTATGTEVEGDLSASVIEGGYVRIESVGQRGDNVLVKAEAKNGTDNTAGVEIDAVTDVDILANGKKDEVLVSAQAWNDIYLNPEIEYQEVPGEEITTEEVEPVPVDLVVENLTNTATVDIDAGENVNIEAQGSATTAVEALAFNEIELDIENPEGEAIVNLTLNNLQNDASVMVNADGDGIFISANGMNTETGVFAEAYNELQVNQQTGEWVWAKWFGGYWEGGYAAELNLNAQNLANNANIGMTALNGNVELDSDEFFFGTEALVVADAYNDFEIDLFTENEVMPTASLTMDGLTNNAGVDVEAGYDVVVHAQDGGEAGIAAYASNYLDVDEDVEVSTSADNLVNNSAVTVDAGGDVIVEAECFDNPSDAYIIADAWNDSSDPDEEPGIVQNNANVDIAAGQDVKVMAFDGGNAEISAYTNFGVDNTSGVTVNTEDGKVLVLAKDGSYAQILAQAREGDNNLATTIVNAVGGDVKVIAKGGECYYDWWTHQWVWVPSTARIESNAEGAYSSNVADVQISATATTSEKTYEGDETVYNEVNGGDVKVIAKEGAIAEIKAYASYTELTIIDPPMPIESLEDPPELSPTSNTANVSIRAISAVGTKQGDVIEEPVYEERTLLEPGVYEEVTYTDGGNVEVKSEGSHAGITAEAYVAVDNTASVGIDADSTVLVTDEGGEGYSDTAEIAAYAEEAYNSNTAEVLIEAGNVLTIATNNGKARIKARAADILEPLYPIRSTEEMPEPDGTQNNASVEIYTTASQVDDSSYIYQYIQDMLEDAEYDNPQLDAFIDGLFSGGHVVVAGIGGDASIKAVTLGDEGTANVSDILICADGGLLVGALDLCGDYANAEIKALSHFGYSNTSDLGIAAPLGLGVLALGSDADASIASKALYGYYNQADLVACTQGLAAVLGVFGGSAEIASEAMYGLYCGEAGPLASSAYTGVAAGEDVLVAALEGEAFIRSEAEGTWLDRDTKVEVQEMVEIPDDPTTADATTVVYSKRGVVAVVDYSSGQGNTAGIVSEAYDAEVNSALTGVVAGSELEVADVFSDEPPTTLLSSLLYDLAEEFIDDPEFDISDYFTPGSVYVIGLGSNGRASILSEATDGLANNAETVVAAPGKVVVLADELCGEEGMPIAQIKSRAGWHGDYESLNTAKTRIYASDVEVDVPGLYRGNAIWAYAEGVEDNPRIPGELALDKGILTDPYTGETYSLTEHGEVVWTENNEDTGSSATLIIQDYSEAVDLPDCPECPCPKDEPIVIPTGPAAPLGVAPIPGLEDIEFLQGGCPALMQWLANEIGVQVDVQVFLANSFVSSTDCQPCETAARLKAAATVLADEDGSYLAAMNQVFNELAPANAPFTPEMASSIVTAFAGRVNDGTQYASAIEYIDAFVQYIAILNTEMGSPVEDSVAYVMEKYGTGVSGSDNTNMAAFIASRMESGETFTQ